MTPQDWEILASHGVTPDNLTVDGHLYLSGTAITALPDNLTVGGSLYLRDTAITALYVSNHGYRLDRAGNSYIAGCRNFTAAEAFDHWGSDSYPNKKRGAEFCAAVMAEESRRKEQAQ